MDKIEKIRTEIERLKNNSELAKMEWIDEGYNQNAFAEDCRIGSFDTLLSFLDTLSEEPDKDLEEAAEEYKQGEVDTNVDYHDDTGEPLCFMEALKPAFTAGAEWMKEHMMNIKT